MTRDEIIKLARDCRLNRICGPLDTLLDCEWDDLHRFAALVAQHEREACAQIVEANAEVCAKNSMLADVLAGNAAAIRARSIR